MREQPLIELREFVEDDYALVPALFALLEPELDSKTVNERITLMREQGWRCLAALCDAQIIGMAGYSTRTHLFSGQVMYVENVVVLPAWRAHRIGAQLMNWLETRARAAGCTKITLDAYLSNEPARAFYQRLGYDPRGVHFVRELL